METATIRIPEKKKNLIKVIAGLENRKMNEIVVELIDDYVDRHKESLELLAIPGFFDELMAASKEFKKGEKGKKLSLNDVRKELDR